MPLVPAICTQCGERLEVDSSKEATVCPSCGTAFITEKAINNYNTTNVTNIGNLHADVVNIESKDSAENRVKGAEALMKMGDWDSAFDVFEEVSQNYPFDWRGWYGMIRAVSEEFEECNLTYATMEDVIDNYERFCKIATPEIKKQAEEKYLPYIQKVQDLMDEKRTELLDSLNELDDEYNSDIAVIENEINALTENYSKTTTVYNCLLKGIPLALIIYAVISCIAQFSDGEIVSGIFFAVVYAIIIKLVKKLSDSIIWKMLFTKDDSYKAQKQHKEDCIAERTEEYEAEREEILDVLREVSEEGEFDDYDDEDYDEEDE